MPEKGYYYHYKHDSEGEINNYAYEVIGVGLHSEGNHGEVSPKDMMKLLYIKWVNYLIYDL